MNKQVMPGNGCSPGLADALQAARAACGSAYIARQTAQVAAALGIILRFTPVRSPQSNAMSEAFVKTLNRDYASPATLPDADTILALLPAWIGD